MSENSIWETDSDTDYVNGRLSKDSRSFHLHIFDFHLVKCGCNDEIAK